MLLSSLRRPRTLLHHHRQLCGYQFDNPGGALLLDHHRWPVSRANTGVNLCRQGESIVVERFGKVHKVVQTPGFFLAVPLLDRLAYVVDTRERGIEASSSSLTSSDNVGVSASGHAFIRFVDAEKAAYRSANPYLAVKQAVQLALRNAVAKSTFEDAVKSRPKINAMVENEIRQASQEWGVHVESFSLTDVAPENPQMGLVAAAAATNPLTAADQQQAMMMMPMQQQQQQQQQQQRPRVGVPPPAPTKKAQQENDAETVKARAKASADAVRLHADAAADAIKVIAAALQSSDHAHQAANFVLAQQQILHSSKNDPVVPSLAQTLTLLNPAKDDNDNNEDSSRGTTDTSSS